MARRCLQPIRCVGGTLRTQASASLHGVGATCGGGMCHLANECFTRPLGDMHACDCLLYMCRRVCSHRLLLMGGTSTRRSSSSSNSTTSSRQVQAAPSHLHRSAPGAAWSNGHGSCSSSLQQAASRQARPSSRCRPLCRAPQSCRSCPRPAPTRCMAAQASRSRHRGHLQPGACVQRCSNSWQRWTRQHRPPPPRDWLPR